MAMARRATKSTMMANDDDDDGDNNDDGDDDDDGDGDSVMGSGAHINTNFRTHHNLQ
jgi:hypothetical protein